MGKSIFQLSSKTSVLTNTLASPRHSTKKKAIYSIAAIAVAGSFFVASGAALTQSPSENIRNPEVSENTGSINQTQTHNTAAQQASSEPAGTSPAETSEPSLDTRSSSSTNSSSASSSEVQVTVNGENIPVPKNGTVHKSVQNSDGSAEISVTVQNSQSSTAPATKSRSSQSSSISIDSSSTSSVQTNVKEEARMR